MAAQKSTSQSLEIKLPETSKAMFPNISSINTTKPRSLIWKWDEWVVHFQAQGNKSYAGLARNVATDNETTSKLT